MDHQPLLSAFVLPKNLNDGAGGKRAGDFACLYYASKNYLEHGSMYDANSDFLHRPAVTFPPHLIFITAYTLAKLSFPFAAACLLWLQILSFILSALFFLKGSSLPRSYLLFGLTCFMYLLFCTSIGLSWFERGQTDLFAASACLFFLKGLRDQNRQDFLIAGVIGSLKWSTLPVFSVFGLASLLLAPSKGELKKRFLNIATSLAVFVFFLLFFGTNSIDYLQLIREFEYLHRPAAMSISKILPWIVAKNIPFALASMFALATRQRPMPSIEIAFIICGGFIAVCYGTLAVEYRLVSLLFLLVYAIDSRLIFNSGSKSVYEQVLIFFALIYIFRMDGGILFLKNIFAYNPTLIILITGPSILSFRLVSTVRIKLTQPQKEPPPK